MKICHFQHKNLKPQLKGVKIAQTLAKNVKRNTLVVIFFLTFGQLSNACILQSINIAKKALFQAF